MHCSIFSIIDFAQVNIGWKLSVIPPLFIILAITVEIFIESLFSPKNYEKISSFVMFWGGIERDRWHEMSDWEFPSMS